MRFVLHCMIRMVPIIALKDGAFSLRWSVFSFLCLMINAFLPHKFKQIYEISYHSIFEGPPVVYISPALHIDLTSFLSTEYLIGDIVILKKSDGVFANIEGRIV